jgi:hypothetical protein
LLGGDAWDGKVKAALDRADIILLLVTANFIGSEYIHRVELPTALKRREEDGAVVVPVLFEDCARRLLAIDDINYLPKDPSGVLKPLASWRGAQKASALTQVASHVFAQIERLKARAEQKIEVAAISGSDLGLYRQRAQQDWSAIDLSAPSATGAVDAESDHFFISYSAVDGTDFALKLADELAAGPPAFPVWVDKRNIRPGQDWDEQIVEAIRVCKGMIFIMTQDSVRANSVCRDEWVRALKYKKPVIPLLRHPEAELPFRLGLRGYIDFRGAFDSALARLRNHLSWMDSPPGRLQALKESLADAERELPRAEREQQARIQTEIDELKKEIARQQAIIDNPQAATQPVYESVAVGLEGERQSVGLVSGTPSRKSINAPPFVTPSAFQDRHIEVAPVGDFLEDEGSTPIRRKPKIFICHANEDSAVAVEIYDRLERSGFDPWLDKKCLIPGQRWDYQIREAVRSAEFFIVLLSKSSVQKTGYVQREFKLAMDSLEEIPDERIYLIPVRIDDCLVPPQFAAFHWVDLEEPSGYDQIRKAIDFQLSSAARQSGGAKA